MMSLGEQIVGAGHAREPLGRGHGPLLQMKFFLFLIGNGMTQRSVADPTLGFKQRAVAGCA